MRLVVHPRAEHWIPPGRLLEAIEGAWPGSRFVVHLYPRDMIADVLPERIWQGTAPYAFRAVNVPQPGGAHLAYVFADDTETPDSIGWLIAHELTHQVIDELPDLERRLRARRPTRVDPRSDRFHEVDPEERACDRTAKRVTGLSLDRAWWRRRTFRTRERA
jgi:hypothetical protein